MPEHVHTMPIPGQILVAGDWHANIAWAIGVVALLPDLLPEEPVRVVVQVGDFGIWGDRHGVDYLNALERELRKANAVLLFIEGNHEDFDELAWLVDDPPATDPVAVREHIIWLPRGYRWQWHGRTWLALGGAVSVDRALLRERIDWWPQEEITSEQGTQVCAAGRADVMICHDAPASVPLRLAPPSRLWALRDLARSARHREHLQDIVDLVQPSHLIHGHYHLSHQTSVAMQHGTVEVTGLDRDNAPSGNYRVLDVRTMAYPVPAHSRLRPAATGDTGTLPVPRGAGHDALDNLGTR